MFKITKKLLTIADFCSIFCLNKENGKVYLRWTGYRSGQKSETAAEMRAKHADRLIREAVWGMIPKGRLGRAQYRKLKVYAGAEHPHAAQNPEIVK